VKERVPGLARRSAEVARLEATLSETAARLDPRGTGSLAVDADPTAYFVPRATEPLAITPTARLIAFYLPQFHPIPENDQWWGPGFTEWVNVARARPEFAGHYQPHLPGELGFYDLRLPDVQRRQVELAKLYGIHGFCFYFYWFGGKTLLEAPIEQYRSRPELDLAFCLCWANENWTRRWDGLDHDTLIRQNHSPDDDIQFIAHIARYMSDSRYIRINGRPLLLVYRPELLPNSTATTERWRTWCRSNGLGEIFLAYTQSFVRADPASYGFDAAVEFPPNLTTPPVITRQLRLHRPDYAGVVYDWRFLLHQSISYQPPPYRLFRGVCTLWDNTPRRPGRGTVFHHASPEGLEQWLLNAIRDTHSRFQNPDERLVFINAWNEWGEGAHLEPDRRYGYAWLQAVRNAALKATLERQDSPATPHAATQACPVPTPGARTRNELPRVTAIVPNYNYAHHLEARIRSILHQTHPILELIILDDASTDDSISVIHRILRELPQSTRAVINQQNSGSVSRQWLQGVEMSSGDFLWIAEADDLSEPGFLASVMPPFDDPDVVMSYCESRQIAPDGRILADD